MIDRRVDALNNRIIGTNELITKLHILEREFQSIRLIEHGYLLTGTEDQLEAFERHNQNSISTLARIECMVKDDPEQQRLLQEIHDTYSTTVDQHIRPLFKYRAVIEENPSLILKDEAIREMLARSNHNSIVIHTLIEIVQANAQLSLEEAHDSFLLWQHRSWVNIFLVPFVGAPLLIVGSILLLTELQRYRTDQEKNERCSKASATAWKPRSGPPGSIPTLGISKTTSSYRKTGSSGCSAMTPSGFRA